MEVQFPPRALTRIKLLCMDIEYEATFQNISKEQVRSRLNALGARMAKKEFLQRRIVFHLPKGNEVRGGWLRVRDEGDKITMSLKVVDGSSIRDQKEICLSVNDFKTACSFLENLGCRKKAYQENRRELWKIGGVEITIDEWPFLEPFVEIEGKSEDAVRNIAGKLEFNYSEAIFGAVDVLYSKKYGVSEDIINNQTPLITFDNPNPFLTKS